MNQTGNSDQIIRELIFVLPLRELSKPPDPSNRAEPSIFRSNFYKFSIISLIKGVFLKYFRKILNFLGFSGKGLDADK